LNQSVQPPSTGGSGPTMSSKTVEDKEMVFVEEGGKVGEVDPACNAGFSTQEELANERVNNNLHRDSVIGRKELRQIQKDIAVMVCPIFSFMQVTSLSPSYYHSIEVISAVDRYQPKC
jgi:hypothetical protein